MRELNINSERWPMVKGTLCAGLYPNLLRVDRLKGEAIQPKGSKIRFHSSSILYHPPSTSEANNNNAGSGGSIDNAHQRTIAALPTDWLLYERVGKSSRRHSTIKCCTAVSAVTVALFAGKTRQLEIREPTTGSEHGVASFGSAAASNPLTSMPFGPMEAKHESPVSSSSNHGWKLSIDDSVAFSMDYSDLFLLRCLRVKFHALVMRRMRQPSKNWTTLDQNVLTSVERLLCNEEDSTGLLQPTGIGQRPRQMQMEFSPRSQQMLFPAAVRANAAPQPYNVGFAPTRPGDFMASSLQQPPPQSFPPSMSIFNGHAIAPPNFTTGPPVERKSSSSGMAFDLGGGGDARPPFLPSSKMHFLPERQPATSSRNNVFHSQQSVGSRPPFASLQSTSSKYAIMSQASAKEHLKFHHHSKSLGGNGGSGGLLGGNGGHGTNGGHGANGSHGGNDSHSVIGGYGVNGASGGHGVNGGHSIGRSSSFEGAAGQKESPVAFFVVKPRSSEVFDYAVAKG